MDDHKVSTVSIGGLIIVLAIIGYLVVNGLSGLKDSLPEAIKEKLGGAAVSYNNGAFNPASVKIKIGDSVKFTNNDTVAIRVSSDPHPVHTSYPKLESGVMKPGDSYVFTATEKVTIKYHNHLNPGVRGEIIIE